MRKEREALGDKLLDILNDNKKTDLERSLAAEGLGELRYAPAASSLIKHIGLWDPRVDRHDASTERDRARGRVCALALRKLGLDAMAPILKKYMEEEKPERRILLENALPTSVTHEEFRLDAIRFIRGFATELTERDELDRLIEFYVLFFPDPDKMRIPPEWLKGK